MKKNLLYLMMVAMFAIVLPSCEKSHPKGEFWGFAYGMTEAQVDSVAQANEYNPIVVDDKGKYYGGNFNAFNNEWSKVMIQFTNDTVSSISLFNFRPTEDAIKSLIRDVTQNMRNFPNGEYYKLVEYQHPDNCILWSGDKHLVFLNSQENGMVVSIFPYSTNAENELKAIVINKMIEEQLKELTTNLAEYLTESNPTLRRFHGDKVTSSNRYLKEHYSDMTDKQKQYYNRLQNI